MSQFTGVSRLSTALLLDVSGKWCAQGLLKEEGGWVVVLHTGTRLFPECVGGSVLSNVEGRSSLVEE